MSPTPAERSRTWYAANAHRYDRRHPGLPGDTDFYASLCDGCTVLDVGAGTGRITEALARVARRVVAVDNVAPMLAIAARRLAGFPVASLVVADADRLPFAGSFDRIILGYRVVQHLDAPVRRRLWHAVRALLRPGGILAFDTWHGPISANPGARDLVLAPLSLEEVYAEVDDACLHVLGVQTSFNGRVDDQSLTRVWLMSPQSESKKSGEKFHEVLDTRFGRI